MKKIKKSTGLTLALLIYVSATAAYFLPRNTEISDTEKYVTVAASYPHCICAVAGASQEGGAATQAIRRRQ